MRFLIVTLALLMMGQVGYGQQVCRPGYPCFYRYQVNDLVRQADAQLVQRLSQAQKTGPASRAAVRVNAGNSCGSGSVCGYYRDGSLVLTNAHVVGTRVGKQVSIRTVIDGQDRSFTGEVIMAAYSSRTLTDWAIVYVEDLTEIKPVALSKEKPSGAHYTRGAPRCVWPLRDSAVITADIADNSPLWRWRPNSIGGQSGSGVWSVKDDLQYGLLTWSWGGLGAGQQTSEIYRQAKERTVTGARRISGLVEVCNPDVIVEDGFYQQSGITDLPIWAGSGGGVPPPGDDDGADPDNDDDCDCGNDDERRLLKRLRDRAKERGVNWIALLELIMKILELLDR